MKLIINYDLLEKINTANGNLNLQRIMLEEVKFQAGLYGFFTAVDLLTRGINGIHWASNLTVCTSWFAVRTVMNSMFEHKFKDRRQMAAYLELVKLAIQLEDFNIITNANLLKESKLITTEYKLAFSEYRPVIQQNKFISVPTNDSLGGIKDTSLLQEHEIGSKQYVLSLGSPSKSFKLSYACN